MRQRFPEAKNVNGSLAASICAGDDHGAAIVRHESAFEPVQGRGSHRRGKHIIDGDELSIFRGFIERRVLAELNCDRCKIFAGGACA